MPPVIQHRCKGMTRDNDKPKAGTHGYLYERRGGVWRLHDSSQANNGEAGAIKEGCRYCDWCDRDLRLLDREQVTDRSAPHRCLKMVEVERRRNEEKAHHKGDRYYEVRWTPQHGWALLNKGEFNKRGRLTECPFCRAVFPFLNQVAIE